MSESLTSSNNTDSIVTSDLNNTDITDTLDPNITSTDPDNTDSNNTNTNTDTSTNTNTNAKTNNSSNDDTSNTKVNDSDSQLQHQRAHTKITLKKSNQVKSDVNEEILECRICYSELDRHDDIRLGCGCIIHLTCLVQWVKSNLEDREQMLGRLRHRQRKLSGSEDTDNITENTIEVSPTMSDNNTYNTDNTDNNNTDNTDNNNAGNKSTENNDNIGNNELSLQSSDIKVADDEDEDTALSLFSPNPILSINTDDDQGKISNVNENVDDNENELVEVIICPYYNNGCKYKETEAGKADIDDKYFISISDLSFIINVQNSDAKWLENLAKDGISPRFSPRIGHEISQGKSPRVGSLSPRSPRIVDDMEFKLNFEILTKLRNWIYEDKQPRKIESPLPEKDNEESSMKYTLATTKPCPSCKVPVSHFHGHACHHIRYFFFLIITFLLYV